MKILQAAKIYPPPYGGIETVVASLAEGLLAVDPEIRVEVLATHDLALRRSAPKDRLDLLQLRTVATLARTPIAPGYPFHLGCSRADLMHFHFPYPWAEFSFLLSGCRTPYVVTYHSDVVRQKRLLKLYMPLLRRFLDGAAAIMVASPHMLQASELLRSSYLDKTEVIPFGLDTARFAATPTTQAQAASLKARRSGNRPSLLFLGRMVYYKGLATLIKAMTQVDANLVLAGDGPLREGLVRQVDALGLRDRITFTGALSDADVPAYFQASDLFVLPSTDCSEAFGLVQLEAHASGVPVVSTNLPTGVTFINQDGRTGLCVPPAEPEALAQAINTLLNHPEQRAQMGSYAQRRAIAEFDLSVMCRNYLTAYQRVLAGNGAGHR